jgi:hypothetical protein
LPIARERTRGANLDGWPTHTVAGVDLLIDPARGRFVFDAGSAGPENLRVRYRFGAAAAIGAGALGREIDPNPPSVHWQQGSSAAGTPAQGIAEVDDSTTFDSPPNQGAVVATTVRSAEGQRPYLELQSDWQFVSSGRNRELTLDGLWIGGRGGAAVRLGGDFRRVTIRFCTLDPGGVDAAGAVLPPCQLVVAGNVDELVIERSILSSILLSGANAVLDRLILSDCIVDARQPASVGIAAPRSATALTRCTLLAPAIDALCLDVERLDASDTLVAGRADVSDAQSGCFRYSARGPGSRVPHPYSSHQLDDLERLFASRRFGDPAYATQSPLAPPALLTGSEQGGEIGAFGGERAAIKLESLRAKVDEFMPFGRLPAYIKEN